MSEQLKAIELRGNVLKQGLEITWADQEPVSLDARKTDHPVVDCETSTPLSNQAVGHHNKDDRRLSFMIPYVPVTRKRVRDIRACKDVELRSAYSTYGAAEPGTLYHMWPSLAARDHCGEDDQRHRVSRKQE